MKRSLLIAVCLVFTASIVVAQPPGSIMLFSDPGFVGCDMYDQVPGLLTVYVVHMWTPGATASQFMVNHWSWGAGTLIYVGEVSPYGVIIGNSQIGVSIAYGACVPSPNLLLTINYFGSGLSAPCSYIQVVPDPGAIPPEIWVVDCQTPPNKAIATGGDVVVNPDQSCFCNVPVQETTWGKVKALYH